MFGIGKKPPANLKKTATTEDILEKTGKDLVSVGTQIAMTPLSMKAWAGDMVSLTPEELEKRKKQDEQAKGQEMQQLSKQISSKGRNVSEEMGAIYKEKVENEKKREEAFLQQIQEKRRREQVELEAAQEATVPAGKRKKKRGSALMPGKQAKPSADQLSSTGEFTQKPE